MARALGPGYVGELGSSRMISRAMDDTIDRRLGCAVEPIRPYLTTEAVVVEDEYSDTQLAELFLHRVLIIPIAAADASTRSSPATTSSRLL